MVKTVKLADIAQKLDVSVVTVSKALSDQKGVSEELRVKIKALAKEMGYSPIHTSKEKAKKSYTIGVIAFENYFAKLTSFYWKMYQELATKAMKKNCFSSLEVISTFDEIDLTPPKLLTDGNVDGVVILGKPSKEYLKLLNDFNDLPMIYMDFYDDEMKVTSVVSAGYYGAYQMTDYLIKNGHSKIAYVGTLMYTESITDRYFGYCKALLENGLDLKNEYILKDRNITDGQIGDKFHIEFPKDMPTAFVCNNDITAHSLISQLEKLGYKVPENISVVGYDDYIYPEYGESKITTYAVDMGEMSNVVIKYMIKYIENDPGEPKMHIVTGRMIERETVKKI